MQAAGTGHRLLPRRRHDLLSLNLCGMRAGGSDGGWDGPVLVGGRSAAGTHPWPVRIPWPRLFVMLLMAEIFALLTSCFVFGFYMPFVVSSYHRNASLRGSGSTARTSSESERSCFPIRKQ